MVVLLITGLILLAIWIRTSNRFSNEYLWEAYKSEYNKTYSESEEISYREIFYANLKQIHEHNRKFEANHPDTTYRMSVNQFSDQVRKYGI